ncbi:MAG: MaoC family dehydratase [Steroidobacteraceae bacterium]
MTSHPAHDPARLYFDDLEVGQRFTGTRTWVLDEAQIKEFASQFDPQPFHLDAAAGRETVFGGLVASGWHTAALTMRLVLDGGPALAGGSVGLGAELTWHEPVRPGDTLSVRAEVIETTPSRSRQDRGRVALRTETLNQHGTVVQTCISRVLVPRRPRVSAD